MRAAVVAEYGGPEVMSVIDLPLPEPAPDSLRLRVIAAAAHPGCFVAKPASVTFRQGAAVPHAALTASQALETLTVGAGDVVLIHAAAGGVGSFAVQLAVRAGARVIGTASAANHQYLRELGAEPVAYQQNLMQHIDELAPDGVDVILDLIGGEELRSSTRCCGPAGAWDRRSTSGSASWAAG